MQEQAQLSANEQPADDWGADDDFSVLQEWLLESEAKLAKLLRHDPDLNRAECWGWSDDREVLDWALRSTPAQTARGIRTKVLAVQAAAAIGGRETDTVLVESIVRDLDVLVSGSEGIKAEAARWYADVASIP